MKQNRTLCHGSKSMAKGYKEAIHNENNTNPIMNNSEFEAI